MEGRQEGEERNRREGKGRDSPTPGDYSGSRAWIHPSRTHSSAVKLAGSVRVHGQHILCSHMLCSRSSKYTLVGQDSHEDHLSGENVAERQGVPQARRKRKKLEICCSSVVSL